MQALVKALEIEDSPIIRGTAAKALGRLGDKAAVQALIKCLETDTAPNARGSAAQALGAIGDKAAVPSLIKALEVDADPIVRGTTAHALGAIGDKAAAQALIKALETDKAPNTRGSAGHALGAIGDKAAVQALIKALEVDAEPRTRGSAANALGAIGDKAAVQALVKALEVDDDAVVRGTAAKAIGTIEDKAAAPALKALVERADESARIKVTAVSALLAVDPDAPVWLLSLAQRTNLAKEVRGRIVAGLTAVPISPPSVAWLRSLVWKDSYGASRTEAARGLAEQGLLDEETLRFALDPSFSRRPFNAKPPDSAVRGQAVGAVVRARAASLPLGIKLFPLAVQALAAPDAGPVIGVGLFPLDIAPLAQARTVLQAFDEALPSIPPELATRLDRIRARVAVETQVESDFDAVRRDPQALLRRFRARVPTFLPGEPPMTAVTTNPVALLITAVGSERKAVLDLLRDEHAVAVSRQEVGGRYFNRFSWPGRERAWDVLLGQPTEKGPHAAQALLQDFVKAHQPELVLMVGMCGGLPESGAKEGMVILGRQVFNYEPARLREGASAWSPSGYRGTARVLDLANALSAEGELGDIEVKTTKDYGSGEKLIDDLASALRQKILGFSGDIIGFEMEGHGLLHAVWELERTMHFAVAVAKGVSDFGDGKLRDGKEDRQRLATQNAARVALKLLSAY